MQSRAVLAAFAGLLTAGGLSAAATEVFVMMPLGTISPDGHLSEPGVLSDMFDKLSSAGVDGIMVDVWWGLTEVQPKAYNFSAYRQLFQMARERRWKVQAVASFHTCGGNVGDECDVPLPAFVRDARGIWYKDAQGNEDKEYISLFADDMMVGDRTPMRMYRDWMDAFSREFAQDMGTLITEVMVGMGPAGEMRYPSYQLSLWNFCGLGQFQAFDPNALASLRAAVAKAGLPSDWSWPPGLGPSGAGTYNSRPNGTSFFTEGFKSDYGKFFLEWYSSSLKAHASRLLRAASEVLPPQVRITGKVSGIHWWYDDPSHAAELTAGYYNTNMRNAYAEIADVFAEHDAGLDFTCLEMRNTEQPAACKSSPEGLVEQVWRAAAEKGIPFGGENALPRYDQYAYDEIVSNAAHMAAFTYLRLSETLITEDNLARFAGFVQSMHATTGVRTAASPGQHHLRGARPGH